MDNQELKALISTEPDKSKIITALKQKDVEVELWEILKSLYFPEKHAIIADPTLRPNDKTDKNGKKDPVSKITYAAEKIAARRFNQMMFTLPVKRTHKYDKKNETLKQIAEAKEAIYKSVRINGVNINRFRAYFGACEVATMWYVVPTAEEHNDYGFPCKWKLRCRSYSPMDRKYSRIPQANIYPLFDENEDLIALSFEYERNDITYFDCYTDSDVYKWETKEGKTEQVDNPNNVPIGKIQGVYWYLPMAVYDGLANNRHEIEMALSRQSDIIRKNTRPIVKIVGEMFNNEDKPATDQAREVYHLKNGGDVSTVTPSVTSENVDFFTTALKKNIDAEIQIPDLSVENTKGLGVTSGKALETLLTPAYMRVGEEQYEIIIGLEREDKIISAFLEKINVKWKGLTSQVSTTHEIQPFVMNDKSETSSRLGDEVSQGIKSRLTAITERGDVEDPQAELQQMADEEKMFNGSSVIQEALNPVE